MTAFVLVHGSWHDGNAWGPVIRALEASGHSAFAPTVAGHGKGVDKNVSHDDCVQSVVDYIAERALSDFVLVGHSWGGTVIARVAEEIPDRIRRLVFWNAFVPTPGVALEDELPPAFRESFRRQASESDDDSIAVPAFAFWRDSFIGDADLETARWSYETLSPEPHRPYRDVLPMTRFSELTIPTSYINATEDTALPPGEHGWHPRYTSRLPNTRFLQMPGSHELLFSAPAALAAKILEASRD